MESVVAVRYAASLFEVGREENCLEQLREELVCLRDLFRENPDFVPLMASPVLTKEEKHRILEELLAGPVCIYLKNFLLVLVDKNRFGCFFDAVKEFVRLYNQANNIQTAVATTAIPLSPVLAERLTAKLEAATGSKILLENKVDPTILGGVVLQLENTQMDASVQGRIDALRRQIAGIIA